MHPLIILYIALSAAVAVMTLCCAAASVRKGTALGRKLGLTGTMAFMTVVSYTMSALFTNYKAASLFASLYFSGVDMCLFCLLLYVGELTGIHRNLKNSPMLKAYHIGMILDVMVLMVNPFREIAIHYVPRPGVLIAHYSYEMRLLYWAHLTFSYSLLVPTLCLLVKKRFTTPREYRLNFTLHLLTLVVIVFLNAVFLFVQGDGVLEHIDISVLLYGAAVMAYWVCDFLYTPRKLNDSMRARIIGSISQGVILFDYEDRMVMWNERAAHLLPEGQFAEGLHRDTFLRLCRIPMEVDSSSSDMSFQFYCEYTGESHPIRCDFRLQRNDAGEKLGSLLVLTDAVPESDLLTGYHSWESFLRLSAEFPENYRYDAVVVMADISGMTEINNTLGKAAGDRLIAELAGFLREVFPRESYYLRGTNGRLIVVIRGGSEAEARRCAERARSSFSGHFVFSVVRTAREEPNIADAIARAERSLRTRKLIDNRSSHSDVLNSLIRALQESDSDTEAHVERTQKMGNALGQRLGLSDAEQADLSLLCVLHDIGKIGIPLEILNKPGRLTPAEWRVMQEHVQKGAQIARSSEGLAGVADMVLHHHERWDGNGYPDGLSKESIPLLSRIISVVDSYDAMVSDRVYRPAMSQAEAMEELRRCAGTQFDPTVVAEFLELLKENGEQKQKEPEASPVRTRVDASAAVQLPDVRADSNVRKVSCGKFTMDADMKLLSGDSGFRSMTGYTREEIESGLLKQQQLLPEEDRMDYMSWLTAALGASDTACCEFRLLRKDGAVLDVLGISRAYFSAAERGNRTDVILLDTSATAFAARLRKEVRTEIENRDAHWEEKYRHDSLTGLMTLEALRSDTQERLLAGPCRILAAMVDLDRFKTYNDSYGHPAGDAYLQLAAQALRDAAGPENFTARVGGDEFSVVLFFPETASDGEMEAAAAALYARASEALNQDPRSLGMSMGTALGSPALTSFKELYLAADRALYDSKRNGRGRLSRFRESERHEP